MKNDLFDTTARQVLEQYPMKVSSIRFIRHSDCVTYKVVSRSGKNFLLRLHIPVTAAMGTHGSNLGMIRSELVWLEALAQKGIDFIQKPLRNKQGELVSTREGDGGENVYASMLHWLSGEGYSRDMETEDTAWQIGLLLGKLHNQSSSWEIPEYFIRPERDEAYFQRVLAGLVPAVEDGRIMQVDFETFARSIDKLIRLMAEIPGTRETHGLMHADMHKGNLLIHSGEIRLIDFSFCAFGNYMFDLGICLSDMKPELHAACLDGYQSLRKLPENYHQLIEAFFIGSMVGTLSFWVHNPKTQEVLKKKAPQFARDYAARFNRDEWFWKFRYKKHAH